MPRAVVFLLAIILACSPASAASRVALVIGNSAYHHAPGLPNPRNDAEDMAKKLEGLGFAVTTGLDLDLDGVKAKLREFRAGARDAELALFFYAGHGIQADGVNYMLPVDADIADETALDLEAVAMDTVLNAMADVPTLVVLLDACRNNPFEEKLARSLRGGRARDIKLGKGLAQIDAGTGTLIAFSTQPGNVALDGDGRNSPFTAGLLKHLGQPGVSLTDELILVRNEVLSATRREQQPWDSSSLTGRVVLNPKQAPEPQPGSPVAADFEAARSLSTRDAWQAFLDRHGQSGDFRVELARRELEKAGEEQQASQAALCEQLASEKTVPFLTLRAGDLVRAEAACSQALSQAPEDPRAQFLLGRVFYAARRNEEAVQLFRSASRNGDMMALTALASIHAAGDGVEKNVPEAIRMYRKAAEGGNDVAMVALAVRYANGDGVQKDDAEALRLYRAAAERGNALGLYGVGLSYMKGRGVAQDEAEAVRWYRKAADKGDMLAMTNLGAMYLDGRGTPRDAEEAVKWFRMAAERGSAIAMYNLARALAKGEGVIRDEAEAARWLLRAGKASPATVGKDVEKGFSGWPEGFAKALQSELASAGQYSGPIDGNFGPKMRAAMESHFAVR